MTCVPPSIQFDARAPDFCSPLTSSRKTPPMPLEISVNAKETSFSTRTTATDASMMSAEEIFYASVNGGVVLSDREETDREPEEDDDIFSVVELDKEDDKTDENVSVDDDDDDDSSFAALEVNEMPALMKEPEKYVGAEGRLLREASLRKLNVRPDAKAPEPRRDMSRYNSLAKFRLSMTRIVEPPQSKPPRVSFGTVTIRMYERIISVNPACTNGVPIGIGWRYKRGTAVSVDEWESWRGEPRSSSQLIIPRQVREALMIKRGYSKQDLVKATRRLLKYKNQRKQTVTGLSASAIEEAVENTARHFLKILSLRSSKSEAESVS